jgi:predicted SprT family Zn-dependent metalloprotease
MDILAAQQLANELMELHGAKALGYRFAWNKRRRAAGICSYRRKTVELSWLLTQHANELEVKDTILHEIAHALTKGHNHDAVWVAKAKEIGCNGDRCYNSENKPQTHEAYKMIAKYKGVCPNGHESFKNRMPTRKHSCGKCCRTFSEKYLIVYSRNNNH